MTCSDCGRVLGPHDVRWLHAHGWVRMRSGGGVNHLALPEYDGGGMCNACMEVRKLKGGGGQTALFE